jgi:outer membrane protein assembly factor BamA
MSRLGTSTFSCLTLSLLNLCAVAQSKAPDSTGTFVLNRIILEGNKDTKPYIVIREIPFKEGDTVAASEIDYARDRIYSTGLFTKVLTQLEFVSKDRADLLIYVEERWHIWPYPIVGFRDRVVVWNKLYAGLGIVDFNFLGMAERLEGDFALGYDPFVSITYSNPSIGEDKDYSLLLGTSYAHGRNVGLQAAYSTGQFDNSFGDFYVVAGKWLDIYSSFFVGAAFNYVAKNGDDSNAVTVSPSGKDIFASLRVEYNRDSRDLKVYATKGVYWDILFEKYGLGESSINFVRASFDAREYLPIWDFLSLAGRFHGSLAEGPEIPRYNHVFFGYSELIRGMFNTVTEGESGLGGNLEVRIPIIRTMYFEIPWAPVEQFKSNRFALYWGLFADAGETSNKNLDMKLDRTLYGYGIGLNFLLPYDVIFQIDYARGSDKHYEFIFDFGETI